MLNGGRMLFDSDGIFSRYHCVQAGRLRQKSPEQLKTFSRRVRFNSRHLLMLTAAIAVTSIAVDVYFIALDRGSLLAFVRMFSFSAFLVFYFAFFRH